MLNKLNIQLRISLITGLGTLLLIAIIVYGIITTYRQVEPIETMQKEAFSINAALRKIETKVIEVQFTLKELMKVRNYNLIDQKAATVERLFDEIGAATQQLAESTTRYNLQHEQLSAAIEKWEEAANEVITYQFDNQTLEAEKVMLERSNPAFHSVNFALTEIETEIETSSRQVYRDFEQSGRRISLQMLIFMLVALLVALLLTWQMVKSISQPLHKAINVVNNLSQGRLIDIKKTEGSDELSELMRSIKGVIDYLSRTSYFAQSIGQHNFEVDFESLGDEDILGNSLLEMRKSLKQAQEEDEKRRAEAKRRQWANVGLTEFGDIMRQNFHNMNELGYAIVKHLADYLDANQAGIFVYNEGDSHETPAYLELLASYAYNRRKFLERKVMEGEGLVGTCAVERKTIYLKDVPNDYLEITSGLGKSNPKNILIVPLKIEEQLLGVIEMASFQVFEKYQIEFIEKVAENIASTLSNSKMNQRTQELLIEAKEQEEARLAQEEEMRQNLEELQATQEEMARKERAMHERDVELNEEIEQLKAENTQLKKKLKKKETENEES